MLTKKEFIELFVLETKNHESEELHVEDAKFHKINRTLTGVVIRRENDFGVVIFPENYYGQYLNGKNIESIVRAAVEDAQHVQRETFQPHYERIKDNITDYEYVKENIYPALINYEKNKKFLKDAPHERYQDLAVIAIYRESDYEIKVTNNALKAWDISAEELLSHAKENARKKTPSRIFSVIEHADNLLGEDNFDLMGITNTDARYGAYSLLDQETMELLESRVGQFYVLPSSVHEVIVVPVEQTDMSPLELEKMVKEINRDVVDDCEVLSDHIYKFRLGNLYMMEKGREMTPEQSEKSKTISFPKL